MEFGPWHPLTVEGLVAAPEGPGAVQLRRGEGLCVYPSGKSAMVFYFFARESVRGALERAFADELAGPGARGQGALLFRFAAADDAQEQLAALLHEFTRRFGAPPVLHGATRDPSDDEDA